MSKGEHIGISGNSGTMAYYNKKKGSYHLHFEVIDSNRGFDWNGGWPSDLRKEHRKNPAGYLGRVTTIEYDLSDKIEKSVHRFGSF